MTTPLILQDSEQATIGALLRLDMADVAQADYGLTPDMFGFPIHKTIVSEIYKASSEHNGMVDPILLNSRLRALGVYDELPNPNYLMDCLEKAPITAYAHLFFQEVKECYERRIAVDQAQTVIEEASKELSDRGFLQRVPAMFHAVMPDLIEKRTPGTCLDELMGNWRKLKSGELKIAGISTGYHELDKMLGGGYKPGLHVIAARTSCGKTSLDGCITNDMAKNGIPVGRVCMDMEMSQLIARDASRLARVPLSRLEQGRVDEDELGRVDRAKEAIKEWPMYICEKTFDINRICSWARMAKSKHNIKCMTLDFIQLCKAPHIKTTNKTEVIGECSAMLKQLGQELGIPVIILAQLNRESDKDQRPPRLSDIKQCGDIEEHASSVILLSQPADFDYIGAGVNEDIQRAICLNVAKNQQGAIGMKEVWFFTPIFTMDFAGIKWDAR